MIFAFEHEDILDTFGTKFCYSVCLFVYVHMIYFC